MKKIYCVVLSQLDEFGNRDHSWEFSSCTRLDKAKKERKNYQKRIELGEFNHYGDNLVADIEIREYESNNLIEII